ncbi:hypothetical protein NLM27_42405 [Bradyrhizobium sp. CCGB12]|uniref:DUF6894 family protein n=1 Tax=Bradyrhizobium sp. CCGB12 TaxID=2949632 RepID=UPI0020B42F41|nr:hypothetical protein [Bradyrhizobium sp. CCGB12]MCP3395376.1 hypothetical protein [Bradyrhizobium sp. CCGB12]
MAMPEPAACLLVFPGMTIFHFDLYDGNEDHTDEDGNDLPDVAAARRLAIEALGQMIIDAGVKDQHGLKAVKVRDARGEVLRVSANVIVSTP